MALTPQLIDVAVERYLRELDRYEKLSKYIGETCRVLLEQLDIHSTVQWRAKDPGRLRRKLEKYLDSGEHASDFTDLDSVFRVLKDLAGTRITTYVDTDRVRVITVVQERFSGFGANSGVIPDVKDQPFGFYRATHCMVRLKDDEAVGQFKNLKGLACEIQVCSLLAHVFNELEHDLRYKPLSGDLSNKENALLNAVARQLEVGDTLINLVRDAVEARQRERVDEFAARQVLVARPEACFRDNPFLNTVADSPVLLKLAGLVRSSDREEDLPETPAEFYQEMTRLLAAGALSSTDLGSVPRALAVWPPIAWRLFSRSADANLYDQSTLVETIARVSNASHTNAAKLLAQMIELGLFLRSPLQTAEEHLQFAHSTFRDFLAASHVAARTNRDGWATASVETWQSESGWSMVNVREILDGHTFERSWQYFFVFVAGLINEPLGLFQMLADRKKDDLYRHRLGLLCKCYRAMSASSQSDIAPNIEGTFAEVLRIAKRCETDDEGHRKPWLEWVEMLLASAAGAERLCAGLLKLDGRYYGWAVSLKVLELFERVLTQGKVTASVVDTIAQVAERDDHQWGVNTARLALRLAEDGHRQKLVSRFATILENRETSDRVRIRLAEAVSTAEDAAASRRAGETLIAMAQADSLAFENSEKAVNGLVSLLETSFAPIAAPLLVNHLLNPSSRPHFWLAWRIIGKAEREPDNPWSAVFLGIILFADHEDDRRLKLWSAQVLSKYSRAELRALGLRELFEMVQEKTSHSWVHAARWLVEYGPVELADKAREALLSEASRHESDHQRVATAELLEMGVLDRQGGPIQDVVREAVLRELEEHGQKYGSRLHVAAPGAPKGNVDLELFADNPAAVIHLLHSFHGPSFYLRDREDPNEEKKRGRHWSAKLLYGTRYWPEVLRSSFQAINEGIDSVGHPEDGALGIVLFGGNGSDLLGLLKKTFERGRSKATMRHYLLEELYERGWRLRLRGRQIEVLHTGKEKQDPM
jgi:ppGpp synthetase/RelA/SpoT-type nucleotidyltranferase